MKNEDLSLDEIYSCTEQGLFGPVRLLQLGQLWTNSLNAGIQLTPRKVQKSFGFEMAGHLAVAPRGLISTWHDAIQAMQELNMPSWPEGEGKDGLTNDQRLQQYAYTQFELGNSLPASLQLVVVNTTRIAETWFARQLRIDAQEQSDAYRLRLRAEKAHRVSEDWRELARELARTGIQNLSSLGIERDEEDKIRMSAASLTLLLMHLNGPAQHLHSHSRPRIDAVPAEKLA